jgi:hypothetical protein
LLQSLHLAFSNRLCSSHTTRFLYFHLSDVAVK